MRFTVDPENAVAESYESNNSLEDRTNAMSFSIYMTPQSYEAYNTPVDSKYPHSAEDWLQKQIAAMNAAFANSIYPVTPQGMALRVRIDTIGVMPVNPEPDGQHDGGWYLQDDVRHGGGYYEGATDIDWGLVHELSHQVSIIDMYAMGVYASNVFVLKGDGTPANVGFFWSNVGLMFGGETSPHNDPHLYDSASAGGASTFAGYRNGYYGAYLFDIPLHNYLRILDSQGNPASGVAVSLYQRTGPSDGGAGHMGVDNIPEMSGMTDANGAYALPNRSANGGTVTANGHVMHDNPFGVVDIIGNQGLLLVKLARAGHEEFHWLDITQFNQAYWLGDKLSHTFTIASHIPPSGAPVAPVVTALRVEGTQVSLDWRPGSAETVSGYRVYRAAAPRYEYEGASSDAERHALRGVLVRVRRRRTPHLRGDRGERRWQGERLRRAGVRSRHRSSRGGHHGPGRRPPDTQQRQPLPAAPPAVRRALHPARRQCALRSVGCPQLGVRSCRQAARRRLRRVPLWPQGSADL